jgi:hypothetical protein
MCEMNFKYQNTASALGAYTAFTWIIQIRRHVCPCYTMRAGRFRLHMPEVLIALSDIAARSVNRLPFLRAIYPWRARIRR